MKFLGLAYLAYVYGFVKVWLEKCQIDFRPITLNEANNSATRSD